MKKYTSAYFYVIIDGKENFIFYEFDKQEFTRKNDMKIYEVQVRTLQLLTSLLNIWGDSVRATHHFLYFQQKEVKELESSLYNTVFRIMEYKKLLSMNRIRRQ